jgi:hypothetical protein
MRDPERIMKLTAKLMRLWHLQPDQRFGQLLENYIYPFGKLNWHEEDDMLERKLDMAITKVSNQMEAQGVGKTARKLK